MNELRQIMADTVEKLFSDQVTKKLKEQAEAAVFPDALLQAITENGLLHVLVPENMGGVSGQFADAEVIARAVGRHAVPLPVVEQIISNYLLASAGITPPDGITVFAPVRDSETINLHDGAVTGTATRVPWGRKADHIAVVTDEGIALIKAGDFSLTENQSIASEPRDTLEFNGATAIASGSLPSGMTAHSVFALGAMMRASQMAGAIEWILEASVQYANDRVQFGRPLGKFQAIQQNMAEMAGHAAASGAAALGAFQAADLAHEGNVDSTFEIAAAKTRISEAAGIVTSHAHQIHGAIGFTYEHDLHFRTRRLWSWRDEFGSDSYWADWIGGRILALEADDLWPWLTTRPT
ncbi:acyl-CoA dehydrogenase family protein [Sneathiella litorea]|uniref:Acyl-CoA dehydrogenase n=1 Tax=Sneathiella litorea TaxID=2606216 RepID=A0A6L8WCU0_9PROT|nr:acyl-CoA dehydrogenase family protein [Sneathiella litorea]MZR32243.1 acyl-CoA dehydrogenase [Sneathiella litorea]